MKNLLMIGALSLLGTVSAQHTPQGPVQAPVGGPTAQQDPAPVKSVYDACLTTAGQFTWTALGLNEDQMNRVSALQARYKEMMAPKVEPKKDAKKSKASKKKSDPKATAQQQDSGEDKALVEKQTDAAATDPAAMSSKTGLTDQTAEAGLDPAPAVPLSVDDELQMILTPEQLDLWNRRCLSVEPTGMVQP